MIRGHFIFLLILGIFTSACGAVFEPEEKPNIIDNRCGEGKQLCDGRCVGLDDREHCGGCDNHCSLSCDEEEGIYHCG